MAKYKKIGRRAFGCATRSDKYQKGTINQSDLLDPHEELLMAVLDRAVRDVTDGIQDRSVQRSGYNWVMSNEYYPFSYAWIADSLNLGAIFTLRLRRLLTQFYFN